MTDELLNEVAAMASDPDRRFAREKVMEVADGLIGENPHAGAAHEAILSRGQSAEWARDEVARVFLAVWWHVAHQTERLEREGGGANMMRNAFIRLENGENAAEVFPDQED